MFQRGAGPTNFTFFCSDASLSFLFLRLVLLVLFFFQVPVSADSLSLDWTSPSPQTIYGPGDTITGEWTSGKSLVSPSVSLCSKLSDDDDRGDECGGAIWPSVEQDGDQYTFPLTAPNVSSVADFYLKLKDDFGNIMKSPAFTLSPNKSGDTGKAVGGVYTNGVDSPGTQKSDSAQDSSSETQSDEASPATRSTLSRKMVKPSPSTSEISSITGSPVAPNMKPTVVHNSPSQEPATVSVVSYVPNHPPGSSATVSSSPGSLNLTPGQYATASRATVPIAAIAIPLALVGATLFMSLILWLVHRRSLAAQKKRNLALLTSQQGVTGGAPVTLHAVPSLATVPSSATIPGDIEKAISVLNRNEDTRSVSQQGSVVYVPVPLQQHRLQRQDDRRERVPTYERSYVPSRCSSRGSRWNDRYESERTPAQEYARSFPAYSRKRDSRNHDYDGVSTTGSILTDYLSPSYEDSRCAQVDSRSGFPRALPRSHTRPTPPVIDDALYTRQDVYEAVNRVLNNSSSMRGFH